MSIKHISAAETKKLLTSDPGLHLWNVVSEEYYKGESIDGSRWLPVGTLAQRLKGSSLPKDANIVVYCAGPQCPASGKAAEELQKLGYKNVKAFEGGLKEWKELGYLVTHAECKTDLKCAC